MDKGPIKHSAPDDGDSAIPSIEDIQKSSNWEDRLAKARLRRAAVLAERARNGGAGASATAASPDAAGRLAKSRARNMRARPARGGLNGAAPVPGTEDKDYQYSKIILAALPREAAPQSEELTLSAAARSLEPAVREPARRRSGALYFAAGVVFALTIAVALPGQFREFTIRTVNQLITTFAQPADSPTAVQLESAALTPAPEIPPLSGAAPQNANAGPAATAATVAAVPAPLPAVAPVLTTRLAGLGAAPAVSPPLQINFLPDGSGAALTASIPVVFPLAPGPDPKPRQTHEPAAPWAGNLQQVSAVVVQPALTQVRPLVRPVLRPVQASVLVSALVITDNIPGLPAVSGELPETAAFVRSARADRSLIRPPGVSLLPGMIADVVPASALISAQSPGTTSDLPVILDFVAPLSVSGQTPSNVVFLQAPTDAGAATRSQLLAAILPIPSATDAPLSAPGQARPLRIASIDPAAVLLAVAGSSPSMNATLAGPFSEAAPDVLTVSLSRPIDHAEGLATPAPPAAFVALAAVVSPEIARPTVENLPVTPLPGATNVLVRAPLSWTAARLRELTASLRETGYLVQPAARVEFKISRANVRYFYKDDAAAARELADLVGARLRDFTGFRPLPPPGTIEVWLKGDADLPDLAAVTSPDAVQTAPVEDPELLLLRDRLVEALRRGDHL